jgi:three-Cys-motif partner protein
LESVSRRDARRRIAGRGLTATPIEFDEIGYWSELKLKILQEYGSAYTGAFTGRGSRLKKFYIDAFCGAGAHISKTTGNQVEGSPTLALSVEPPFDHFYFIDIDANKTDHLRTICEGRTDVTIRTGDTVPILKNEVLPKIHYKMFNRALCLLDPYGLHLEWEVIRQAGQSKAIDMFLNFPVMDMNRNAIWHKPSRVSQANIDRMNRFWGDDSWKKSAYGEHPQRDMFDGAKIVKQNNDAIVAAFRDRLKKFAGFEYVPEPMPMRNDKNAVVYYLFFASPKPVADRIIKDIFKKYWDAKV